MRGFPQVRAQDGRSAHAHTRQLHRVHQEVADRTTHVSPQATNLLHRDSAAERIVLFPHARTPGHVPRELLNADDCDGDDYLK